MGDCYSFLENGFVVFFYGLILVSTKGPYQRFLDSFHAVEETDAVLRDGGAVHGQVPCLVAEPFLVRHDPFFRHFQSHQLGCSLEEFVAI